MDAQQLKGDVERIQEALNRAVRGEAVREQLRVVDEVK